MPRIARGVSHSPSFPLLPSLPINLVPAQRSAGAATLIDRYQPPAGLFLVMRLNVLRVSAQVADSRGGGCRIGVTLAVAMTLAITVAPFHSVFGQFGITPSIDAGDRALAAGELSTADQIDVQRERLFDELAEEFTAFDRLGHLVRRVSQLVKPSVIHIEAHKVQGSGPSAESYDEAGSGVVLQIAGQSWVLTNRHVIHGAKVSQITMRTSDGRQWRPGRVLMDANTDVAVIELSSSESVVGRATDRDGAPQSRMGAVANSRTAMTQSPPPARVGDSDAALIGDFVIAIGSPFGLSHSVTFGIISAKGRRDLSLGEERIDLQDFFQTDAAINPGNSGGPLLNLRGEVIAINTAIASSSGGSEGIGFAIPINMAMRVAQELIQHGSLRRGYLGVTLDPEFSASEWTVPPSPNLYASMKVSLESPGAASDLTPQLGGARVKEVRPGSPAEVARLQRGDIVVQFGSRPIEDDDHLVAQVGLAEIGKPIEMVILRDGKRYRTEVVLTLLP